MDKGLHVYAQWFPQGMCVSSTTFPGLVIFKIQNACKSLGIPIQNTSVPLQNATVPLNVCAYARNHFLSRRRQHSRRRRRLRNHWKSTKISTRTAILWSYKREIHAQVFWITVVCKRRLMICVDVGIWVIFTFEFQNESRPTQRTRQNTSVLNVRTPVFWKSS